MKLWEIFRFELTYQLSRWTTWLYFLIFMVLTFAMAMSFVDNVRDGDYLLNAPIVVGAIMSIASLLNLLVVAAVAGDAATHDMQERIEPLLYTSPLTKFDYLGGRFLGAFVIGALLLSAVPVGLILSVFFPGVDASLFGPFELMSYINAYLLVALPNVFVVTALLFVVALLARHSLVSFLVGVFLFLGALTCKEILGDQMGKWDMAKLLDLSGFTVFGELKASMSPVEINVRQVAFDPWLLLNRVLWLTIALAVWLIALINFQFAHHVSSGWWKAVFRKKRVATDLPVKAPIAVPQVNGEFNRNTSSYQFLHLTWSSFYENIISWGWMAMAGLVVLLMIIAPELLEGPMGVPRTPATGLVISIFTFFPIKVAVVALVAMYVGQVVWRERDAHMSDISDAAPVHDGVLLASKFLSVVLMLVLLHLIFIASGVILQVLQKYYTFELSLYLQAVLGLQFTDYLLFAVVAMAVHVLVNQKYVGHLVLMVIFLFTTFSIELGIRHKLLIYGEGPAWSYFDISGFGSTVVPWLWYKIYWAGWALLLAILARLFWVRGRETALNQRLQQGFKRPATSLLVLGSIGVLLLFTSGAFVLYNTNVLNKYTSPAALAERRAAYERRYGKYRDVPQPRLTATSLHVEIFPEKQEAVINGIYILKNKSSVTINSIHLASASEVETSAVSFNREAKLILEDKDLRHFIYKLERPLQPGDSLLLNFTVLFNQKGFTNSGINKAVVDNGTFFVAQDWLPAIGYQANRELANAYERIVHNLPAKLATPSLYDEQARYNMVDRERVRFEATAGTTADQIAVAPGNLNRSWTENGRRYFHYTSDSPIRTMAPVFSAKYKVRESKWNDVQIQIYHHPEHTHNLDRMMQSAKTSLAYYTKHLGPYPHKQLKFVEYAGKGVSASAYPGTIAYTEGLAAINSDADYREIDLPFAVVAHEIAHQWWAHQLIPAPVEGAPVLAESLSWYSALGVVEETYGKEHLQRLLYVMRNSYLTPRSKADVPLLRATDQFLAYRKGPFAMHMLQEYVGQEQVNVALRSLLKKYNSAEPPLPTSLDLYRELKAVTPDSLKNLLADLFESNTYWEVETKAAEAQQLSNGKWQLTLDVKARKEHADTVGAVTEIPIDDMIEIGVFAAGNEGDFGQELYLKKHRIRSGSQRITIVVPEKPAHAGIDPNNLLIDTYSYDNTKKVKIKESVKLFGAVQVKHQKQLMRYVVESYL